MDVRVGWLGSEEKRVELVALSLLRHKSGGLPSRGFFQADWLAGLQEGGKQFLVGGWPRDHLSPLASSLIGLNWEPEGPR